MDSHGATFSMFKMKRRLRPVADHGSRGSVSKGGVRLNPTTVMITSQLRASEVVALIVSVEIARAVKAVPFAGGAERALAKIEQALPAAELRALRERILVGEPSTDARLDDVDPHLVEAFETAFTATRLLAFTYRDQQGRRTNRRVEPHGLLIRQPQWYVIAWDTGKRAPRLFRADRVSTPTVTDQTFVPRPSELVTGVCPDAKPARLVDSRRDRRIVVLHAGSVPDQLGLTS